MKRNFSEFINVSYYDDTNSWLKKKEQILEKWIELNDDFELIKNKYASKVEYLTLVKQLIRGKEDIKEIEKDKNLDKEIKDKTIEKKFNTKSTNIVKNISKIKGNLSETRENLKILIEETDLDKTDKCDDEEDEEQSYFTLNQNDSFSIKDQEDQKNWKDEVNFI